MESPKITTGSPNITKIEKKSSLASIDEDPEVAKVLGDLLEGEDSSSDSEEEEQRKRSGTLMLESQISKLELKKEKVLEEKRLDEKNSDKQKNLILFLQTIQLLIEPIHLAKALYSGIDALNTKKNCSKFGYMTKQGGMTKGWKQRLFVLKENFLFYYKSPKSVVPQGVILLMGSVQMNMISKNQIGRDFCFSLIVPSREYIMAAPTGLLRDEWMASLRTPKKWWEQFL